MIFIIL